MLHYQHIIPLLIKQKQIRQNYLSYQNLKLEYWVMTSQASDRRLFDIQLFGSIVMQINLVSVMIMLMRYQEQQMILVIMKISVIIYGFISLGATRIFILALSLDDTEKGGKTWKF